MAGLKAVAHVSGGGGTIGDSIAANQVAFGSGTDEITGNSGFTFDGTTLELASGKLIKGQYSNNDGSAYINPDGSAVFANGTVVIDNAGNVTATSFTPGVPISLANGGFGQSMTMTTVATSGTINNLVPTTGFIRLTSALGVTGIVSDGTAKRVTLYNANPFDRISIPSDNTGSTAANRFHFGVSTINIPTAQSIEFVYDPTISRWTTTSYAVTISSPLSISDDGRISMPAATTGNSGYLSGTDYNTFNDKVSATGGDAFRVGFFNGASSLTGSTEFNYNPNNHRLGVGTADYSFNEATGHFKSDFAETVPDLSASSLSRLLWTPIVTPDSSAAIVTTPNMPQPTGTGASINYSGTGYTANGDTIDYIVRPAYDDGLGTITWGVAQTASFTAGADDGSTNPYSIDVSWGGDAGVVTPNYWVVLRQINGGGFTDYLIVTSLPSPTYADDNTGWVNGSPNITPQYPDFLADGTNNFTYNAYGKDVDPQGNVIYSPTSDTYTFTDPNDGSAFLIQHTGNSGSAEVRVVIFVNHFDLTTSGSFNFIEQVGSPFIAGDTVTPNTFGYQANGSNLNITYNLYNFQTSPGVYSSGYQTQSSSDPGDFLYYYNVIQWTGKVDAVKLIRLSDNTGIFSTLADGTNFIDAGEAWADGTVVTPTSLYAPAFLADSHGSLLTDTPGMISRSLDGNYSRFEFQNNMDVRLGYIEQNDSYLRILSANGEGYIAFGNAAGDLSLTSAQTVLNALPSGFGSLSYNGTSRLQWGANSVSINGAFSGSLAGLEVQSTNISYPTAIFKAITSQSAPLSEWLTTSGNGVIISAAGNLGIDISQSFANGANVSFGTSTGTKFGTSTSQKQAFYNSTPIVQPGATTDLGVVLSNLGLRASGTAYPITTSGAVTLGSLTAGRIPFAGTAGLLSDDAALLWNNTSKRLGIGRSPTSLLDIYKASSSNFLTIAADDTRTASLIFEKPAGGAEIFVNSTEALFLYNYTSARISIGTDGGTNQFNLITGGKVGLNTISPTAFFQIVGITEQLRSSYNASNYFSTTVDSSGNTTLALTGTSPLFTISQGIINSTLTASSPVFTDGSKKLVSTGIVPVANGGTGQATPVVVAGSFSGVGTATTTFTVTIGTTQANNTYKVNVTPTNILSAAVFYVNNKTTTTFDVVYLAGLTGTVTYDWSLFT